MKFIHYAMLVCAALATGLPDLAQALPPNAAPYVRSAVSMLVLVVSVLGAVSKSAATPDPAPASSTTVTTQAPAATQTLDPQPMPALSPDLSAKPAAP